MASFVDQFDSVWRSLQERMDIIVDSKFSEPIEIHPYRVVSGGYSGSGSEPDPNREILKTNGCLAGPGSNIIGEGGTMGAGGLNTRMVAQEFWLSLMEAKGGDIHTWKKGDRVYAPERNDWYEIVYSDRSWTGRPLFHLVQLNAENL